MSSNLHEKDTVTETAFLISHMNLCKDQEIARLSIDVWQDILFIFAFLAGKIFSAMHIDILTTIPFCNDHISFSKTKKLCALILEGDRKQVNRYLTGYQEV